MQAIPSTPSGSNALLLSFSPVEGFSPVVRGAPEASPLALARGADENAPTPIRGKMRRISSVKGRSSKVRAAPEASPRSPLAPVAQALPTAPLASSPTKTPPKNRRKSNLFKGRDSIGGDKSRSKIATPGPFSAVKARAARRDSIDQFTEFISAGAPLAGSTANASSASIGLEEFPAVAMQTLVDIPAALPFALSPAKTIETVEFDEYGFLRQDETGEGPVAPSEAPEAPSEASVAWWVQWHSNCPAAIFSRNSTIKPSVEPIANFDPLSAAALALPHTPRTSAHAPVPTAASTPLQSTNKSAATPQVFLTPMQTYEKATETTPPRGGLCAVDVRAVDAVLKFGIPHAQRPQIWSALVEVEAFQAAVSAERLPPRLAPPRSSQAPTPATPLPAGSNKGYYAKILADCNAEHPVWSRVIRLDLDRTFATHRLFYTEGSEAKGAKDSLYRVLTAYAVHNPQVGYCQGMSFLVGVLLMIYGLTPEAEERSFWLLTALMAGPRYSLHPFFEPGMSGLLADSKLLQAMLAIEMPDLHDHLVEENRVDMVFFTARWFLPLFTDIGNWHSTLRIWDLFWAEGKLAIFRIALALLKSCRPDLLGLKSLDTLMPYILNLPQKRTDVLALFPVAQGLNIPYLIQQAHKALTAPPKTPATPVTPRRGPIASRSESSLNTPSHSAQKSTTAYSRLASSKESQTPMKNAQAAPMNSMAIATPRTNKSLLDRISGLWNRLARPSGSKFSAPTASEKASINASPLVATPSKHPDSAAPTPLGPSTRTRRSTAPAQAQNTKGAAYTSLLDSHLVPPSPLVVETSPTASTPRRARGSVQQPLATPTAPMASLNLNATPQSAAKSARKRPYSTAFVGGLAEDLEAAANAGDEAAFAAALGGRVEAIARGVRSPAKAPVKAQSKDTEFKLAVLTPSKALVADRMDIDDEDEANSEWLSPSKRRKLNPAPGSRPSK